MALHQGRPVFVDFTASWCLSCQVNERVAFGAPEVQKAFADNNVVLLRADWTRYDDSITQTLTRSAEAACRLTCSIVPGEKSPRLLPEVLTPGIVTDALAQLPHPASQSCLFLVQPAVRPRIFRPHLLKFPSGGLLPCVSAHTRLFPPQSHSSFSR